MNFQIGDEVKVISLSKIEELYPEHSYKDYVFISKAEGCCFVPEMLEFCGLTGTITNVWYSDDGTYRYSLSFDNGEVPRWSWVPEFFEAVYVSDFGGTVEETTPAEVYWEQIMPQIKEIVINAYNKGVEIGKAEHI